MLWKPKLHFKSDYYLLHSSTLDRKRITELETIFSHSFFNFYFLYSRLNFTFKKLHTFCISKTMLCIHKLEFNIPNLIMKFNTNFPLLKKRHSVKLQFYISNSSSDTVFWSRNCNFTFQNCLSMFRIQKHILFKNYVFYYSKPKAELWHQYKSIGNVPPL